MGWEGDRGVRHQSLPFCEGSGNGDLESLPSPNDDTKPRTTPLPRQGRLSATESVPVLVSETGLRSPARSFRAGPRPWPVRLAWALRRAAYVRRSVYEQFMRAAPHRRRRRPSRPAAPPSLARLCRVPGVGNGPFFPASADSLEEARTLCRRCAVKLGCLIGLDREGVVVVLDAVDGGRGTTLRRAVCATEHLAVRFGTMAENRASAVIAMRCKAVCRTLDAVEHIGAAPRVRDAKDLVVLVAARIADRHRSLLSCAKERV